MTPKQTQKRAGKKENTRPALKHNDQRTPASQEPLRVSESLFKSFLDAIQDAMVVIDQKGMIILANRQVEKVFGYTQSELLGKNLSVLIPERFRTRHDAHEMDFFSAPRHRADPTLELFAQRKDSTEFPAEIFIAHLEFEGQMVAIASVRDITGRKQAQEAFRQSEEKFSKAFISNPAAIILSRLADGLQLDVNEAYCRLVGYSREELLGHPSSEFDIFIYPEQRPELVEQLRTDGAIRNNELTLKNKAGELRIVLVSVERLNFNEEECILSTIVDITDLKQAQADLLAAQQFNRSTIDGLKTPLCVLDVTGTVLNVNRAWREFADANPPAPENYGLGSNYLEICEKAGGENSEEAGYFAAGLRPVLTGASAGFDMEYSCHSPAGEQRWFIAHVSRFLSGGRTMVVITHEDITARKLAEESIRISELRFRALIEHGRDNISLLSADGTLVWESPSREHILGYAYEEFRGRNIFDLVHPEDLERVQAQFARILASPGNTESGLFRLKRADGTWRWVEANGANLLHMSSVGAVVINYRDITERKQSEEAVAASETRFRALFEEVPIAIWEQDFSEVKKYLDSLKADGVTDFRAYFAEHPGELLRCVERVRILDVNQSAVRMYEAKDKAELIHATTRDTSQGELDNGVEEMVAIVEGRASHFWEGSDETMKGRPIEIYVNWSVVPGSEADFSRVIVTTADITESKRIEEELRRSENRYRLATQATNDVIWEWNAATHELHWTENVNTVFGYSSREAGPDEKWWDDHIHPEDRGRVLSNLNGFIAGNATNWADEYRFRRKDGSYAFISDHSYVERDVDGNPLRMVGAMSDVTERKQYEQQLKSRADEFSALYETTRGLSTELEVSKLLKLIVERTNQLLESTGGFIYLYDPAQSDLVLATATDPAMGLGVRLKMGEGMAGRVAASREPLIVDDYQAWAGRADVYKNQAYHSIVEVPMLSGGELIGVLGVEIRGDSQRKFEEQDARLLSLFAGYASGAVRNARLLESVQNELAERKQAEAALAASEARYRALFEDVPIAIWEEDFSEVKKYLDSLKAAGVTDFRAYFGEHPGAAAECSQKIRVLDVNRAALNLFKAGSKAELIEITSSEISPGEAEHNHEDFIAIAEGRSGNSWEGADTTLNGDVIQVSLAWSVVPGFEGDYSRVILTTTDITERKRAEDALRASEETFHGLFNSVAEAIYIQDVNGRFLDINEGVLQMYGYTREFFIGNTPEPLSAPGRNNLPEVAKAVDAAFKGEPQQFEFWGIRSNGEVFPKEVRLYKGTYFGQDVVIALAQDITERKQAEENLRQSEERFRTVADFTYDWEYWLDEDRRLIYISPSCEKVTGYSRDDFINDPELLHRIVHADDRRIYDAHLLEEYHLSDAKELDFRIITAGGETRWIAHTCRQVVDQSGRDRGRRISNRDITERKQAEETLTQQLGELELLYRSGLALSGELEPKQVAEKLIEALETKMDWHHIAIRKYDPEHDRLEVLSFKQPSLDNKTQMQAVEERFNEAVTNSSTGLSGWVVRHGQAVRSGNVKADERYTETYPDIQSGLYAPMTLWDRVVGVISVESEGLNAFTESDERLLKTVANQAAVAFENARLFQDLQHELVERIQAEAARQQSEERYRQTLDTMMEGCQILGFDWQYLYINEKAAQQGRFSREALLGHTMPEVYPGIEATNLFGVLCECMESRLACRMENEFNYGDGTTGWFDLSIQPVPEGIFILSVDITERKQAEQALRESEARLGDAARIAHFGYWDRDYSAKTITLSEEACRIFGISSQYRFFNLPEWHEQWLQLIHPEDRSRVEEILKDALAGGPPYNADYRVIRPDGEIRHVHSFADLTRDESGKPIRLFGTMIDITERKLAEREIVQRTQDLTLINALNEAANRGESVETITNVFSQVAYSMFDCRDAAVYLLSPDGKYLEMQNNSISNELTRRIEEFIGVSIPRVRLPIKEVSHTQYLLSRTDGLILDEPLEIQKWILEFTETTFLPDVLRAPVRAIIPRIFELLGIRSAITIPLVSSGQTIGLMDFSSAGQFTNEDLERLIPISRQMTAILMRKQVESVVEIQLKRITALNDIDRAIGSSLDMRLSLEVLLKEVVSQLGVDAADILLMNPVDLALEYFAGRGFRTSAIRQTRLTAGQGLTGKAVFEKKVVHVPNLRGVESEVVRKFLLKGEDFVEYFAVPLLAKGTLKGVLEIFNRAPLVPDPDWLTYLETLGGQAAIAIDNAQLFEGLQTSNQELMAAYDATISGWSQAMDLRDEETEGHTQRVTELTRILAIRMGVSEQDQIHMRRGALLHDIGKLGVPDHILLKPGPLTPEEWDVMHKHPTYAFKMLLPIAYLQPALDIPYCHHEKWDGSGYPRGLKGEQIPLAARIFAVVDVWDALRSDRPYRQGWSAEKVRDYIRNETGKHFDPNVVGPFLAMLDELPDPQ